MDFCSENYHTHTIFFYSRLLSHILYFWNCEGLLLCTVTVTNQIIVHVYAMPGQNVKCRFISEGCKCKHHQTEERIVQCTTNSVQPPEKWNFIKSQLKFLGTRTCRSRFVVHQAACFLLAFAPIPQCSSSPRTVNLLEILLRHSFHHYKYFCHFK